MNVLVGCERSGKVREAFRQQGHRAWSCDLEPADDGGLYHLQHDVLVVMSMKEPESGLPWDLGIFFPPCTHLAVSGAHLFKKKQKEQAESLEFVRRLLHAPIPKIALENPVGVISSRIRKPTQIIQPYMFGHDASKKTCLWLEGLPALRQTQYVPGRFVCQNRHIWKHDGGLPHICPQCQGRRVREIWGNQTPGGQNKLGPSADRAIKRAETYAGIAEAMATQWGK